MVEKMFLKIVAEHNPDGEIRPLLIKWKDGRVFTIDKITDVRQAPAMKVGGHGTRYTCRVGGKEVYLFCDEGRWFVESKQ